MILKHLDLSKNLNQSKIFYLLYGFNTALIDEVVENELKPKLSKNIFVYDEGQVINDFDNFLDNVLNRSFFDNDKLIIINRGTDKILEIIKILLEKSISETTIVIKSNTLDKKSKLRNFFEKNQNLYCVPFYEDNNQSLNLIVRKFFSQNKINISSQVINYIVDKSHKNRSILKNDLEKIKNFYQKKKSITLDEISKLTNTPVDNDLSELSDQILLKNKNKVIKILNENPLRAEDSILILKVLLNKIKRLKNLKKLITNVQDTDKILISYRPIIFWKDKEIIKHQLKILSLHKIDEFIKTISILELCLKKNPNYSDRMVNNFILEAT